MWHSLLEGWKVLETSCLWHVREGNKIPIFQHKWLRDVLTGRPTRQGSQGTNLIMVEDLIDNERRCQNSELVMESFCLAKAQVILDIMLSRRRMKDRLMVSGSVGTIHCYINL